MAWYSDRKERTVLQGVVDGLSNRKIGDQIGVSESTIKATLQNLFSKAGVRKRSQLVRIALERTPLNVPKSKEGNIGGLARITDNLSSYKRSR